MMPIKLSSQVEGLIIQNSLHNLQEDTFKEQIQGLLEEEEGEEEEKDVTGETAEDEEDTGVVPSAQQEKKTEKQRRKEKADKIKVKYRCL